VVSCLPAYSECVPHLVYKGYLFLCFFVVVCCCFCVVFFVVVVVVYVVLMTALSALISDGQHSEWTKVLDSIRSVTVGVVCLEYDGQDVLPEQYKVVRYYICYLEIYGI